MNLNDLELYELCFGVDEEGNRTFTGEKLETVILERYAPEKDTHREFNPAIIEGIEPDGIIRFWDLVREQWMYVNWTSDKIPIILHIKDTKKLKFEDEKEIIKKERKKEIPQETLVQEEAKEDIIETNEVQDSIEPEQEETKTNIIKENE